MTAYTIVDTSTLKGLEKAERLQRFGWRVTRVGLFSLWMTKDKVTKRRK